MMVSVDPLPRPAPAFALLRQEIYLPAAPAHAPLAAAPKSDAYRVYETLGYIEDYDEVLNCDYGFVAYTETEKGFNRWRLFIKSTQTAGASFEPATIEHRALEAAAQDQSFFTWGYGFEPTAIDPRRIEFRVHVANARPTEVEIFVQLRLSDHTAAPAKSLRFAWPQGHAI